MVITEELLFIQENSKVAKFTNYIVLQGLSVMPMRMLLWTNTITPSSSSDTKYFYLRFQTHKPLNKPTWIEILFLHSF